MIIFIAYIVLFLSFFNLLRMAFFIIASDVHDIKKSLSTNKNITTSKLGRKKYPLVSVVVPAHNEELTLSRNLESIRKSYYKKIELIIVNDSSTDRTYNIARSFQKKHRARFSRIKVINVQVRGKAGALNAALRHVRGELFMCLDADSALTPESIEIAVNDFRDPTLACMSSNVKIFSEKGALNFFQRIEYLVCYQMKKAETVAGIQYIVGGIGSMFRTSLVKQIGGYDTDTITEDIDLSMKIISEFGGKYRVGYNPNVITYTESVHDIKGLFRQRFRWKYGRYQAFLKHKNLFWSNDKRYSKSLSWIYLPYALLSELFYILEPLILVLITYLLVRYGDATIIASSFLIFSFYTTMHVTAATSGYTTRERLNFIAAAPFAYMGMYVLSLVEYSATIYGLRNLKKIFSDHRTGTGTSAWKHVERKGNAVIS